MVKMQFSAGLDVGSVMTKCVLLSPEGVKARTISRTGARAEDTAEQVFNTALGEAGLKRGQVVTIATTGYGRRLVAGAHQIVTEISAAAVGAHESLGKKACLILDVGGQDTKAVEVDAGGGVSDFLMNDKCAAGTGRFLELMAHVFETDCDGLSDMALRSKSPVTINSTCSVFAESEVVSLVSHAVPREDIAAGLFGAIAGRIAVMARHFGLEKEIVFCGGGARLPALQAALEKVLGLPLIIPPHPQFVTAFGAALLAGKIAV